MSIFTTSGQKPVAPISKEERKDDNMDNKIDFYTWATTNAIKRNSPQGDFARDMLRDKNFPKGSDFETIRGHLVCLGACYEAIQAFDRLWREYLNKTTSDNEQRT